MLDVVYEKRFKRKCLIFISGLITVIGISSNNIQSSESYVITLTLLFCCSLYFLGARSSVVG
jgi:hypothetical protein